MLLRQNPLADISHTRSIEALVFDGGVRTRAELDNLLEGVAARVAELDPEVELPRELLERYAGTYEASFGRLDVSLVNNALWLSFPNRGSMRLRAFSETDFVYLPRESSVAFDVGEDGEVLSLQFEQRGQGGTARRVE